MIVDIESFPFMCHECTTKTKGKVNGVEKTSVTDQDTKAVKSKGVNEPDSPTNS